MPGRYFIASILISVCFIIKNIADSISWYFNYIVNHCNRNAIISFSKQFNRSINKKAGKVIASVFRNMTDYIQEGKYYLLLIIHCQNWRENTHKAKKIFLSFTITVLCHKWIRTIDCVAQYYSSRLSPRDLGFKSQ